MLLIAVAPAFETAAKTPVKIIDRAGVSDGKGIDLDPFLQFSETHNNWKANITAIASDTGNDAGLLWIKIYEDGAFWYQKDCYGSTPCIAVINKTEEFQRSHTYYAKTEDIGGHVVQSDTATIHFEGINHAPNIDSYIPTDLTPDVNVSDTLHFEVWASDPDNDVLEYSWRLDGVLVRGGSTATSWNYNPDTADVGIHDVEVIVEDALNGLPRGGQDSQAWTVTVLPVKQASSCSLVFTPTSPITYDQQPFTAFCACTNPETSAQMFRNGADVSNENGIQTTLAANNYNYVCNVSETANYLGASTSSTYVINRAASQVDLLLNGIDGDITVLPDADVMINGSLIVPILVKQSSAIEITDARTAKEGPVLMSASQAQSAISMVPRTRQSKQGMYHIELWIDGQMINSGNNSISYTASFSNGTHSVTILYPETENYTASSETHFVTVDENADVIAPVVTLIAPIDGTITGARNVTVNYTVTDNNDTLLDCEIWSNTSGAWQFDGYVDQVVNDSTSSYEFKDLALGTYMWNVQCSDDSGNAAFAPQNWSFTVVNDVEAPVIVFVSPTPSNGATIDVDYTFINTTITDNVAVANAVLEWDGANETMNGSGTNYYADKANLTNGTYTYRVHASDDAGNWNVSATRTLYVNITEANHNIAVEALTLLKDVNGVNKSIESSTAYLDDQVYVLALVHNLGNVEETVNVTLQNNIGIISTRQITLNASEAEIASFVWNANPEGWHTVRVIAEPVNGETNLSDNELSQDVQVWEVCNVVDCSIFGPRTGQNNYTLGQVFLTRTMIQNLWNNETFKDVKFELVVESAGLQIIAPWPSIQHTDLNNSQFVVGNWNVTSMNTGNYSITAYAGNREFSQTKYIEII